LLFQIQPAEWRDDADKNLLNEFGEQVILRMSDPPWNDDYALRNNITVQQ